MSKIDPKPNPEELAKRRALDPTKFTVDPYQISKKEDLRARNWAHEMMKKHESKLDLKVKENAIIASGEVEPEAIDVRSIYPFKDLHWYIYRRGNGFHFALTEGRKRLIFTSGFLKT